MKNLTFFAFALLFLNSCSKSNSNEATPQTNNNTINNSSYAYFSGNLGTNSFNFHMDNLTSPTHYLGYSDGFSGVGATRYYRFGSELVTTPISNSNLPRIAFTFESIYSTIDPTTVSGAFYGLFTNMSTNFISSTDNSNNIKGIVVNYQPTGYLGAIYSTLYGSQSGSSITYTSSTSGTDQIAGSGKKTQTVTATLNCKLYNSSNPADVITLTNGQYKLIFREP